MTAEALVQARIDTHIKEEAAAVLSTIGLTVSDAVRLLLTRVAQDKAMPFNPLIPNAETVKALEEAKAGHVTHFETIDALFEDLNADD